MIIVKANGNKPQFRLYSPDQELLIAGLAYGLKANDSIHRFSLYAFVQSHLDNKSEENLQKKLETNIQDWQSQGNGIYKLTEKGYLNLLNYTVSQIISTKSIFTFSKKIDEQCFSVSVDPNQKKYIAKQNNKLIKATEIINNIQSITKITIATSQTSLPRKILNWILKNDDFSWVIENFEVK